MKPSFSLRDLAGWLAVLAMFALLSPGVSVVRAESADRVSLSTPAPGPSCQADRENEGGAARALTLDVSRLAAHPSRAGVVSLDTGGYGYDEEPAAEPDGASVHIVVVPVD
jgi:hypothetical protein